MNKRYLKRKKTNIQQIEVGLYKNYEIKAKYGAPEINMHKVKKGYCSLLNSPKASSKASWKPGVPILEK